jgi:hypothetical protein
MLVADDRACVVAVNSRWCEWSGLDPEDSLGSGWTLALADEERSVVTEELLCLAKAISQGVEGVSSTAVAGPGRRWWLAPFESAGQVLIGIVVAEQGGGLQGGGLQGGDAPSESSSPFLTTTDHDDESLSVTPGLLDGMDAVIAVLARLATNIRDS